MTLGPRGRMLDFKQVTVPLQLQAMVIASLKISNSKTILKYGRFNGQRSGLENQRKIGRWDHHWHHPPQSFSSGGVKNIASGANPTSIKRGMDKALDLVLKEIDKMAIEVKGAADTKISLRYLLLAM